VTEKQNMFNEECPKLLVPSYCNACEIQTNKWRQCEKCRALN
jgi:hypothetical protein